VQKIVECFYPGAGFPSISTTGGACALNCKHCAKKYLEGMIPATTPEDLLQVADALAERGASGFLLSGGLDPSGRVRLDAFEDAIREIKSTTELRINAHIGLTPKRDIERLIGCGIDSFSVDVYGSDETIREVLGLDATVADYVGVVRNLVDSNAANVAPHICVGIHGGSLRGESNAIEQLRKIGPSTLVFIALIPTRGTAYQGLNPVTGADMVSVISKARSELPDTRLLLGCMRPKRDRSWEPAAVKAGLDGIVLPSESTLTALRGDGYTMKKRSVCCALP